MSRLRLSVGVAFVVVAAGLPLAAAGLCLCGRRPP